MTWNHIKGSAWICTVVSWILWVWYWSLEPNVVALALFLGLPIGCTVLLWACYHVDRYFVKRD